MTNKSRSVWMIINVNTMALMLVVLVMMMVVVIFFILLGI